MAVDINLTNVQQEAIVVSANKTAENNKYYIVIASSTFTDPSPTEGKGYIVFVRNGTATVGGTGYAVGGTIIYRFYHSGAWSNEVHFDKDYYDTIYKATFTENTGFNKNFGTTSGTVANGLSLATFMAIPKVCFTAVGTMYNTYVAGTRWMSNFSTSAVTMAASNVAIAQQPATYSIVSTDYPTIDGVTPKFRLRATIGVNNTAPAANISFGLFPLTTPASSGGVTVKSWTIGAEVVGSKITQNTPAANTQYQLVSATFGLPADGLYAICITNSAQTAANSYMTNSATLEVFY